MRKPQSLALTSLLLLVPAPSIGVLFGMILAPSSWLGSLAFVGSKIWLLGLPVAWLVLVDQQPISWSRPTRGGFGAAVLLGVITSAVVLATFWLLGDALIDRTMVADMAVQVGLDSTAVYLAGALYWITINAVLEEYVWRWFVVRQAEQLVSPWGAIAISAAGFTLHHIVAMRIYFTWTVVLIASVGIFIGGATWSWLYQRYRSVWPAYLSHAIVDAAIFFVGYRLIFT